MITMHKIRKAKVSGNHPKFYNYSLRNLSTDQGTLLPAFSLNICCQDLQDNPLGGCIQIKACHLHCRITSISSSRSSLLISSWSSTTSRLMSDFKRDAYKDTYSFRSRAYLNNCSQDRLPLHI